MLTWIEMGVPLRTLAKVKSGPVHGGQEEGKCNCEGTRAGCQQQRCLSMCGRLQQEQRRQATLPYPPFLPSSCNRPNCEAANTLLAATLRPRVRSAAASGEVTSCGGGRGNVEPGGAGGWRSPGWRAGQPRCSAAAGSKLVSAKNRRSRRRGIQLSTCSHRIRPEPGPHCVDDRVVLVWRAVSANVPAPQSGRPGSPFSSWFGEHASTTRSSQQLAQLLAVHLRQRQRAGSATVTPGPAAHRP